jgi:hypothetical protein
MLRRAKRRLSIREHLEIRLDEDLDGLVAVNLDTNRSVVKSPSRSVVRWLLE